MSYIAIAGELADRAADCSIFERALDALPDGVLLVNAHRKVVYTNAAFKRLWRVPDEVLASRNDEQNLQFVMDQLVDPQAFRREVERIHFTTETSDDEIEFKDGRIISRRSLPFQENGSFSARIWIFTDVTEAKNASVDQLTQLPNRLAFARQFPSFVTAAPNGLLRSVAIVDIDQFKMYNDHYGHAKGDEVLNEVGSILKEHVLQTGDLVFRIGGEEFLMATRTRHSDEARTFFELIRERIQAMGVAHVKNLPHRVVTASIGFTCFLSAPEPGAIFRSADEALYRAKADGRNRIARAA